MVAKHKLYEKMGLIQKPENEDENNKKNIIKSALEKNDSLFDQRPSLDRTYYGQAENIKAAFSNVKKDNRVVIFEEADENKEVSTRKSKGVEAAASVKKDLISIEAIYRDKGLESDEKKMIFVADAYLKAIPESLDQKVRRETLHNIMAVSGLSVDNLKEDAKKRQTKLEEVLSKTKKDTSFIIEQNESKIEMLMDQIEALEKVIEDRKVLQNQQGNLISEEKEKIDKIVAFIDQ